jgi:hypothetical protein
LTAAAAALGTTSATTGVLRIPNAQSIYGCNAANNADVAIISLNSSNRLQFDTTMQCVDGAHVVIGSSTGNILGSAASQQLAFHDSTAVIQRAGAAQAAVATTASTQTTPFGFTTAAQADATATLVNEIRSALVENDPIKRRRKPICNPSPLTWPAGRE